MSNDISLRVVPSSHDFDVVHIEISGNGIASVADAAVLSAPTAFRSDRGVVLSGKAPGWLYGSVSALFRKAPWRAAFDPRPGLGAVVFAADARYTARLPGDVISLDFSIARRSTAAGIRLVVSSEGPIGVLEVSIDRGAQATPADLISLRLPPTLEMANGVIIAGRMPRWLALYLFSACDAAPWCGSYVPGLGVVVVEADSTRTDYARGQVVPPVVLRQGSIARPAAIVAVGGPPHSGKSVFFRAMQIALAKTCTPDEQRRMCFVRLCPDGEGNWTFDVSSDARLQVRDKRAWDDEFVDHVCRTLLGLRSAVALVVADLGGRIDSRNMRILHHCTHGIIVSSDRAHMADWRTAFGEAGLLLVAEAESVLQGANDVLEVSPLRIRICGLQRDNIGSIELPALLVDRIRQLAAIS